MTLELACTRNFCRLGMCSFCAVQYSSVLVRALQRNNVFEDLLWGHWLTWLWRLRSPTFYSWRAGDPGELVVQTQFEAQDLRSRRALLVLKLAPYKESKERQKKGANHSRWVGSRFNLPTRLVLDDHKTRWFPHSYTVHSPCLHTQIPSILYSLVL